MAIIFEQIVACCPLLTCCHRPHPPCLPAPAAGTRQLGAAVGGLTLMMPPAQTLLTQTLLLLLTRNEPAYCSAPVGGWVGGQMRQPQLCCRLPLLCLRLLGLLLVLLLMRNEPAYCSAPVGGWERIEPSGGCSGPVCTCPLHVSASWPL